MNTLEDLASCISDLKAVRKRYRVLPHGVVAVHLRVSKQRLSDLIAEKQIETEPYFGSRVVVVASALKYAKVRYQRVRRVKRAQSSRPSSRNLHV